MRGTDIFDVSEGEVKDGYLNETRQGGSNNLCHKHSARWDLKMLAYLVLLTLSDLPSYSDRI